MPTKTLPDSSQATGIPMVLFTAGEFCLALEARFVAGMTDTPSATRLAEASALLFHPSYAAPQPTYWLTLNDANGPWQLGVNQPVTLSSLAASELYPLPPLLKARSAHPALCGVTFEAPGLRLLLDAHRLHFFSPSTTSS